MGFNLLEAMLGSTIFLFGAVAAAPLLTETARACHRSEDLLRATTVAQKHLNSIRTAIRKGEDAYSEAIEKEGFRLVQSVDGSDPGFYRLSIYVFPKNEPRMLVELISLVEKP